MDKKKIDPRLFDQFEPELMEGEELLWIEAGNTLHLLYQKGMVLTILITIMLMIMTCFFASTAQDLATTVYLLLLMFIVAVLGLAKLLWDYFGIYNTIYAITNQRAVIIQNGNISSYREQDIQFIRCEMFGQKERGDIIFKDIANGQRNILFADDITIGFFWIQNPRDIEALMRDVFHIKRSKKRSK